MARWHLKAAVQGTIALMPRSTDINRVFQRRVTRSLDVTLDSITPKWNQTAELVNDWRTASGRTGPFTALEIGTGWLPVAPLALRAAGASAVVTIDITPLLVEREVRATMSVVAAGLESSALESLSADLAGDINNALAAPDGTSPAELLKQCGIDAMVGDAGATTLDDGSIELSISNNTFEHIAPEILERILIEMRRLSSSVGGGSAHFIDLKDHYALVDPTIGVYNFLQYPDRRWRWFNNPLQYQNRLRASDYRRIAEAAGFSIALERNASDDACELPSTIASQFDHYERDDLLVHSMWVTLVPADSRPPGPTSLPG